MSECVEYLRALPDNCIDSVVTDPPYGLSDVGDIVEVLKHWLAGDDGKEATKGKRGFMGREWDSFVPGPATWREVFRVLKPGGYLLAFAGTRTVDLMGISIRLAGFIIRDSIQWHYGSGFPKSLSVSLALDEAAGATRETVGTKLGLPGYSLTDGKGGLYGGGFGANGRGVDECRITAPATDAAKRWDGWGTALKPAHEPILVARKPLEGTVANNITRYGTGGINVNGCRITAPGGSPAAARRESARKSGNVPMGERLGLGTTTAESNALGRIARRGDPAKYLEEHGGEAIGRWPANLILSHSPGCRRVGTKKVRASSGIRPSTGGKDFGWTAKSPSMAGAKRVINGPAHCDEEGLEEVEAWECEEGCPIRALDEQSIAGGMHSAGSAKPPGGFNTKPEEGAFLGGIGRGNFGGMRKGDTGGASRFFNCFGCDEDPEDPIWHTGPLAGLYQPKADRGEREVGCEGLPARTGAEAVLREEGSAGVNNPRAGAGRTADKVRNFHPTVKSIELMRWLCRLVTQPGGIVLDPFTGSGSTGCAAILEGFRFVGCDMEPDYIRIAEARIAYWTKVAEGNEWTNQYGSIEGLLTRGDE